MKHPSVHTTNICGFLPFWKLMERAVQIRKSKCWLCFWHSSITKILRLSHPCNLIYLQSTLIFHLLLFFERWDSWKYEISLDAMALWRLNGWSGYCISVSQRWLLLISRLKCLSIFPYAKSVWFLLSASNMVPILPKDKENHQLEQEK